MPQNHSAALPCDFVHCLIQFTLGPLACVDDETLLSQGLSRIIPAHALHLQVFLQFRLVWMDLGSRRISDRLSRKRLPDSHLPVTTVLRWGRGYKLPTVI